MSGVLRGEVQQRAGGRWRTVLTAGGIPVQDNRRPGDPDDVIDPERLIGLRFGFDGTTGGTFVVYDADGGGFWSWSP